MNSQQTESIEPPFQYSLRALMIVTTLCALFIGLSVSFKAPEIFAAAAVVFCSLLMRRLTKANKKGILSWCIATEMMICASFVTRIYGLETSSYAFFGILGIFGFLFSGLIFLISAKNSNNRIFPNIFGIFLSIITPILFCSGIIHYIGGLDNERSIRQAAENTATMKMIILEIEAVHVKLGRAPKDENELVQLLRKPIPGIHIGNFDSPIQYQRLDDDHFHLKFVYCWDIFTYDSQTPKSGWVKSPF